MINFCIVHNSDVSIQILIQSKFITHAYKCLHPIPTLAWKRSINRFIIHESFLPLFESLQLLYTISIRRLTKVNGHRDTTVYERHESDMVFILIRLHWTLQSLQEKDVAVHRNLTWSCSTAGIFLLQKIFLKTGFELRSCSREVEPPPPLLNISMKI